MTREEQLNFCRVCIKRKMNMDVGLVCSLTDKKADFENECENFELDEEEKKRLLIQELDAAGDGESGGSIDFKKNKTQGLIFIFCGIALNLIIYLFLENTGSTLIFYGIILYGIYQYFRGREQEKILKRHAEASSKTRPDSG